MKIQEVSEVVTKGRILFPSSKIFYMEANTQKDEEIGVPEPRQHSHALGTSFRASGHMRRRLAHECRRLVPKTSLTCA